MSASLSYGERPPLQGGFRRSFTAPARQLSVHEKAALEKADAGADILYSHPTARIISFSPPTDSIKSTIKTEITAETDYPVDTVETLPWRSRTETLTARGLMVIEKVRGSTNFLKCQDVMHAILRNSQCWCVDGESKFVLRVRKFQYYRIELPSTTEDDKIKVEELKKVLPTVLRYERTPCPFIRAFTVDLPDDAITPRRKGQWKRRDSSQPNTPDTDTPPLRRTKPTRSWSMKSPPTSYPKNAPGSVVGSERGRQGNSTGIHRQGSLFDKYRNSSPASFVLSEDGTDSEQLGSEHDSEVESGTDRSETASPRKDLHKVMTKVPTTSVEEAVNPLLSVDTAKVNNYQQQPSHEHTESTQYPTISTQHDDNEPEEPDDLVRKDTIQEPMPVDSHHRRERVEVISLATTSDDSSSVESESQSEKSHTQEQQPEQLQSDDVERVTMSATAGEKTFMNAMKPDAVENIHRPNDSNHKSVGLLESTKESDNESPQIEPREPAEGTVAQASSSDTDTEPSESTSDSESQEDLRAGPNPAAQQGPKGKPQEELRSEAKQFSKQGYPEGSPSTPALNAGFGLDTKPKQETSHRQDRSVLTPALSDDRKPAEGRTERTERLETLLPVSNVAKRQILKPLPTNVVPHVEDAEDFDGLSPASSVDSFHTIASTAYGLSLSEESDIAGLPTVEQRGRLSQATFEHSRDLSETTVTAPSISEPVSPEHHLASHLETEQNQTPSLLRSSASDASWPEPSTPSATQDPEGLRQRVKARRSFSPLPPASTLFTGSQIRHDSGSGHMTKAILQKIIVKPIEVAILIVHILARIASGATVNDLMSGELFKTPEHGRRISGFADQLNGGRGGSESEDDYGMPIRGRRRSAERRVAKAFDEDEDNFEDVD